MSKPKPPAAPKEPKAPSNPLAIRIGDIFHRKPGTKWHPKEIKAYLSLLPIVEDELLMVERYYKAQWPPGIGTGRLIRTNLITFLNHFAGEVDRARIYCSQHPVRNKIIKFPTPEPAETEWTEAEAKLAAEQKAKLKQFRESL